LEFRAAIWAERLGEAERLGLVIAETYADQAAVPGVVQPIFPVRCSSRGEVEKSAEDAEDKDEEHGDDHAQGRKNEIAHDADPAAAARPHLEGIRRLLGDVGNGRREGDSMRRCRRQRCGRAQEAPLRQQPDTSRDDQCQRDQSPLGPTMTASAVFVKRDRTPVNGKHDHPSGARPLTALGVSQVGIGPGEGTVSQSSAWGVGLRMRTRRPVALRQISRHKNAHGFRIGQSRDYGGYEGRL